MTSSPLYPVFLSLEGRSCLVVGLGSVGQRKIAGLIPSRPAFILGLDVRSLDDLDPQAQAWIRNGTIHFEQRKCTASDIAKSFLVFACANDQEENLRIAVMCRQLNTLCNSATQPEAGDFYLPAVARRGEVCIAISTQGASPLLAAQWKRDLAAWLEKKMPLAWLLGQMRNLLLRYGDGAEHVDNFRKLADSPLPEWLQAGKYGKSLDWLASSFPKCPLAELEKIVTGYSHAFPG